MLLEKFSDIIDRSPIGAAVEKRRELINKMDPRRIYPENIRSFFHIPLALAKLACEMAVREGLFEKRVGYLCPNDDCQRLLTSTSVDETLDEMLVCETCEALERETYKFSPDE